MSPAWLVSSMRASYPGAEVAKIESYNGQNAVVLVRWTGQPSSMMIGESIAPMIEGVQVPLAALPVGTIQSAQEVDVVPGGVEQAIDAASEERAIVLRLGLSAAILAMTWYLSRRVKHV